MLSRLRLGISIAVPAVLAVLIVLLEPRLTAWMKERESALLVAMLLLFTAMLHPRLRHLLIVSLCYGVAFLALRDAVRVQALPPQMDYVLIEEARPAVLLLVTVLAGFAAFMETVRPGNVWARRGYFGAAALYFSGLGIINFGWHQSWQSILLCVTGIIALFGCIFTPRIIADEQEAEQEDIASDEAAQREREAAHLRALRAKEWRDTQSPGGETPAI